MAVMLLDTAAHFSHQIGSVQDCGLTVALQIEEEEDYGDTL